jgi:uncharacterized protein YjbI with pentapeptide repeats
MGVQVQRGDEIVEATLVEATLVEATLVEATLVQAALVEATLVEATLVDGKPDCILSYFTKAYTFNVVTK